MKRELLCPAGNMESLLAAINGGADAIYAAMKDFGARKFANNFTREEIKDATRLCHLYGVKLYITMNTLVKDNEVDDFLDSVNFLYNTGVDALLIQDFGMMNLVLNMYPDFEVHASTQFNNSSLSTIKLLKDIGVKRVVLSREMTIDEINAIDVDIEKEVFVHGALCISYSGNCLFSSMLGNRSGNRGECTGSCRLPYKLYDGDTLLKSGYLLSTKELNTSSKFDELLKTGVVSFKIEGRMKSPEYVYFITKFYRNIIDGKGYTDIDTDTLKILFNREFTTGNLFHDNIMNIKSPNHIGLKIGNIISTDKDYIKIKLNKTIHQEDGIRFLNNKKGMIVNFLYNSKLLLTNMASDICYVKNNLGLTDLDEVYLTSSKYLKDSLLDYKERKIPVNIKFSAHTGEVMSLTINNITVEGGITEKSINSPISKNRIKEQLEKLGNTIYEVNSIYIDISDDIFIPIGVLNKLRRECIEKLNDSRCLFKRDGKKDIDFLILDSPNTYYESIIVHNLDELNKSLNYNRFYTSNISLFNKYKDKLNIYYIEERNRFTDSTTCKTLSFEYRKPNNTVSNYSYNVMNIYSVYYLLKLGFTSVTLSVELSEAEISSLINNFYNKFKFYPNVEVIMNDRIELMIIKGNILDIDINKEYFLIDFKDRSFPVYFDGVNTHILNFEVSIRSTKFNCNRRYNYKYLK